MSSPLIKLYRRLKKTVRFFWRTKSLCRVFCVLFGHCYAPFRNAPETPGLHVAVPSGVGGQRFSVSPGFCP